VQILADTSIWIDHLRQADPFLLALLRAGRLRMHSFVVGELVCGNLADRPRMIKHLDRMPQAKQAFELEVRRIIEDKKIYGLGIGWIDAHLLASALISDYQLYTRDRRLALAAEQVGARLYQPS